MATIYVRTTGNDDPPGDGTLALPYLTAAKALTVVSAYDTINFGEGTFPIGITDLTQDGLTIQGASQATTILDSGLVLETPSVLRTFANYLRLYDFTLRTHLSGGIGWYTEATVPLGFTGITGLHIKNVTVESRQDALMFFFNDAIVSATIEDSYFEQTGVSDVGVDIASSGGTIVFRNTTIESTGSAAFQNAGWGGTPTCYLVGCTFISAVETFDILQFGTSTVYLSDTTYDAGKVDGVVAEPTTPIPPTILTASAASSSQIDLAWLDNANDETGFVVERSADGSTGWASVNTPAADATTYSNSSLSASTAYHYRVKAMDGGTSSPYSNVASATTEAEAAPGEPDGMSGGTKLILDL